MKKLFLLLSPICIFLFISGFTNSSTKSKPPDIHKPLGAPYQTLLNINNISHWLGSDGESAHNPYLDGSGIIFPRHTASVIFEDGIVWGGQIFDGSSPQLRVGGSTYSTGLIPGAILGIQTGNVENQFDPNVRIWRVRRDWETADLSDEVQDFEWDLTVEQIRQQYQTDWNEWPATKGAPFEDVDQDGVFNPQIDAPGIPGSDQTVWYVANDINGVSIYGSPAIGLEMQVTMWAYHKMENDPFGDIVFKQVRIIYKGTATTPGDATIGDMYLSQWIDPDLGAYTDDFVGCDSILSMGFGYNSSPSDVQFAAYEIPPPAFGYMLLHGPKVYSPGDTALVNFVSVPNYKNLSMSSFLYFSAGSMDSDPQMFDYNGTLQWYNLMQGLRPQSGQPWINPVNGKATVYPLSGDPITGEGWIDGISYPASDRRMGMTCGPFSMALGDTQEVMVALIGESGSEGYQAHLKNITGIKNKAKSIKGFLKNKIAALITAKSVIPLFQETGLKSSYLLFDPTLTIEDIQWDMIHKPDGSNAILYETTEDSVYFISDIEGVYNISLTINTLEGFTASDTTEIYASTDKPPVVDFTLTPETIILGSTLLADAFSTYDPEGDSMEYKWNIMSSDPFNGIVLGTILENGRKYEIEPTSTGEYTVYLTVSDGIFDNDTTKVFHVQPKLENISLVYSYIDTSWYRTLQYYFYDDKLFIAIEPLNIVRIYNLQENDISIEKDIAIPDPVRVYKIEDNLMYIGTYDSSAGYWGPGKLSIYQLGSDWETTPVLENYLPGYTDIFGMSFIDDYVYLKDYFTLYRMDFKTNPSSPQILAQHDFLSLVSWYPNIVGPYFYVKVSNRIEVIDKVSLEYISDLPMPQGWKTFNTSGSLMFTGIYDTLHIYSVANPLQPVRLSFIVIPPSFDWRSYLYSGISCGGSYIEDNILAVNTGVGIVYYDINNPSSPKLKGAWYSGKAVSTMEHNGQYYIVGMDVMGSAKDNYFGINKVNLDFISSIPGIHVVQLPNKHSLNQNYPNPFNPTTTIEFSLPKPEFVTLTVFNILGQQVSSLVSEKLNPGIHKYQWQADNLPSGIYYCRIEAGEFEQVRKMILLK